MKKYLLALLLVVFLASCQSATETANLPTATLTQLSSVIVPTPQFIPTSTGTPQPPLTEHEWTPQTVLLRLDLSREKNEALNPPQPPQFILYADGRAFLTRPAIEGYPHGARQILFKQMERDEVCRILNTMDQIGFLDYNPSSYEFIGGKPNMVGAVDAYLEVNAWKSHKREYIELPFYIFDELTGMIASELQIDGKETNNREGFPVISSALRNAYYLTSDYPEDGFDVYEPEATAVWIRPLDPLNYPNVQWENWQFQALTISYMFSKIDYSNADYDERYFTLRKQGSLNLYEYLKGTFASTYYIETNKLGEKKYYAVYARPLLPYEQPGTYGIIPPTPASTPTASKMKCSPADGVMEVPAPNLIYMLPIP